jgi:hypothetical protein
LKFDYAFVIRIKRCKTLRVAGIGRSRRKRKEAVIRLDGKSIVDSNRFAMTTRHRRDAINVATKGNFPSDNVIANQ